MYITISPQKLGDSYSTSVADFVEYLEKENKELHSDHQELFFSQDLELISPKEVVREIDANTAKVPWDILKSRQIIIYPQKSLSKNSLKWMPGLKGIEYRYGFCLSPGYLSCLIVGVKNKPTF